MKKLKNDFNKKAKRIIFAGAAALGLMAGLGAEARMADQLLSPAAIVLTEATTAPAPAAVKVKYAYSVERLEKIKTAIELSETGRALLDFAATENIRLEMSNSKTMDDNPKDSITIKGRNYSTLIQLNGDISSDDDIMITLAHELRHSWHERTLKNDDLALTPRNEWLKRRIQEADCFAFEIHFAYEYEKATGKRLSLGDRNPAAGQTTYAGMLGDYTYWRNAKNATVADSYSKLLVKTFTHVHNMSYDKRFVTSLSETWLSAANSPSLRQTYKSELENPASDADFVAAMRLVATAGLKPGEDPVALAAWLDSDFLGFEKTGGKPSSANMKIFNAAQLKFDEAKEAWKKDNEPPPPEPPAVVPPPATITPAPQNPVSKGF